LPSLLTHCVDNSNLTPQTKNLSTKGSVWVARSRLRDFSNRDLKYLAGDDSEYKVLHCESHHSSHLRAVAILVERYLRNKSPGRNAAIRKMFTYVTGYATFKEAYDKKTSRCHVVTHLQKVPANANTRNCQTRKLLTLLDCTRTVSNHTIRKPLRWEDYPFYPGENWEDFRMIYKERMEILPRGVDS
jgi:hypothetical protein